MPLVLLHIFGIIYTTNLAETQPCYYIELHQLSPSNDTCHHSNEYSSLSTEIEKNEIVENCGGTFTKVMHHTASGVKYENVTMAKSQNVTMSKSHNVTMSKIDIFGIWLHKHYFVITQTARFLWLISSHFSKDSFQMFDTACCLYFTYFFHSFFLTLFKCQNI